MSNACWFCRKDSGEMLFDTEFDTYLHKECLVGRLSQITKEDRNSPEFMDEALVMEYLVK